MATTMTQRQIAEPAIVTMPTNTATSRKRA